MVADKLSSLSEYYPLSEGLRNIGGGLSSPCPEFASFVTDRKMSTLFIVEKGEALMSTSWREEPDSADPLAAVRVAEGGFVLYLPGEPYLVRPASGASVSMVKVC